MKRYSYIIAAAWMSAALSTAFFVSCDKQADEIQPVSEISAASKIIGPYTITFDGSSVAGGNTVYSYTIQLTGSPQGNGLSHWVIGLATCPGEEGTVVLSATIDGNAYTDISSTEGLGTGCIVPEDTQILKFDNLADALSDGQPHTYTLTVAGVRGVETNPVWLKYGNNCSEDVIEGPGCLAEENGEGCSMSQGFYFAKPNYVWESNVVVGGYTYTQAEGKAIWNTSNKGGMLNAKKAFLQVATIKLSSATVAPTASVWAYVSIAEAYLSSIPKLTPTNIPPNSPANKAAGMAGGDIGNWIDLHHCEE